MNEEELKANKQVSEYVVHDLNLEPDLPFPDNSFDVVTNAVSVDYLNKPLEVCNGVDVVWAGACSTAAVLALRAPPNVRVLQ